PVLWRWKLSSCPVTVRPVSSLSCAASPGKTRSGSVSPGVCERARNPHPARPTTTVSATSASSPLRPIISGAPPASGPQAEAHGQGAHEQRHGPDVDRLDPGLEAVDVLVQVVAHVAQLLARRHALLLEAVDLGLLLRAQDQAALVVLLALQLGEPSLGLVQLVLQGLLARQQALLGLLADRLDALEGPVEAGAVAQADQLVAARQVVER